MNAPFTESIVGSWRFIRSTHPGFKPEENLVWHFTSDGKMFPEMQVTPQKRCLLKYRYRISNNILNVDYTDREGTHILSYAEGGCVECTNSPFDSSLWWMIRLKAPETFSIAFVGLDGLLERIQIKTDTKSNS